MKTTGAENKVMKSRRAVHVEAVRTGKEYISISMPTIEGKGEKSQLSKRGWEKGMGGEEKLYINIAWKSKFVKTRLKSVLLDKSFEKSCKS